MPKLSTYQRLKQENEKLKQQLMIVAGQPNTFKAELILFEWRLFYNMEQMIWAGSPLSNERFKVTMTYGTKVTP